MSVVNGIDLSKQDLKFGRSEIKSEAGFDYACKELLKAKMKHLLGRAIDLKGSPIMSYN